VVLQESFDVDAGNGLKGTFKRTSALDEETLARSATEVAPVDEDGGVLGAKADAAGMEVIDVEVGEQDGADRDSGAVGGGEEQAGASRRESGIDEERLARFPGSDDQHGAIAA
jgi:hypothetical protein